MSSFSVCFRPFLKNLNVCFKIIFNSVHRAPHTAITVESVLPFLLGSYLFYVSLMKFLSVMPLSHFPHTLYGFNCGIFVWNDEF